jgi:hypothetical protein
MGTIAGSVSGIDPEQNRVVLYSHIVGGWWIQPFTDSPFTAIDSNLTWKANIHLGFEYAAQLVHQNYTIPTENPVREIPDTSHASGCIWAMDTADSIRAPIDPLCPDGSGTDISGTWTTSDWDFYFQQTGRGIRVRITDPRGGFLGDGVGEFNHCNLQLLLGTFSFLPGGLNTMQGTLSPGRNAITMRARTGRSAPEQQARAFVLKRP